MDQKSAESLSDRDLLVHIAVKTGVLDERTEGLPELRQRLTKVEGDTGWLKRMFWGFAVPGTMAVVAVLFKTFR